MVYLNTMKTLNEMRVMQVGEHVWEKESERERDSLGSGALSARQQWQTVETPGTCGDMRSGWRCHGALNNLSSFELYLGAKMSC